MSGSTKPKRSPSTLLAAPQNRARLQAFIEDHLERYMLKGQTRPLQSIQSGGGSCVNTQIAAVTRGGLVRLLARVIVYLDWTGPTCLAHAAFDEPVPSDPFSGFGKFS